MPTGYSPGIGWGAADVEPGSWGLALALARPDKHGMSDLTLSAANALRGAGALLRDLTTPTVRLGVTGLARAGKTVFITALVRNLIAEGALPFFGPVAEGRIMRAYLEPQPDLDLPRFAYEDHLAALARDPPAWPESTRRISQLRVTVEFVSAHPVRRRLGASRLHLDIVDYPGEWLLDLPLMSLSYREWSTAALIEMRDPRRQHAAEDFVRFLRDLEGGGPFGEPAALSGAGSFTRYLDAARREGLPPTLGPGRFLLPGDLAGSPLLTFFPLPSAALPTSETAALARLLARRFDAYKAHVVTPFFRDHFAKLDRQIVLVDALSAIDAGPPALHDLERSLGDVLACFRPGALGWLSPFLPRRIDRVLLAATKADHLHHTSHDRLEAILGGLTRRARSRAERAGAEVRPLALAALRATRETERLRGGERLACIVGTPLPGERIGSRLYDGCQPATIFPGDLPATADEALTGTARSDSEVRVIRFRPPRVPADGPTGAAAPWPHIRLDRALDFIIGDRLT